MRLLQVSPFPAYPPTSGGEHRIHGLLKGREPDDEVIRFSFGSVTASEGDTEHSNPHQITDRYYEYIYRNLVYSIQGYLSQRIGFPPVYASKILRVLRPTVLDRYVDWADLILIDHPWHFGYVTELVSDHSEEIPIVYSSHNFECELHGSSLTNLVKSRFYKDLRRVERQAVTDADLLVVTSERDEQQYRTEFDVDTPCHIAPNAAYVPPLNNTQPNVSKEGTLKAIFVGSGHQPNIEAVEYILDIAAESDDISVTILGSVCNSFTDSTTPHNVELCGFVDNLEPYYQRCDIALNPITSGSGTNVKVLEYLSYSLPVVTTPFGIRGLPLKDGEHVVVKPIESFETGFEILSDPDVAETIGQNGRLLIERKLNWENVSTELFERLRKLSGT